MRSEGYGTRFVCLYVCLLPHFLPLCATREQNSDTRFVTATVAVAADPDLFNPPRAVVSTPSRMLGHATARRGTALALRTHSLAPAE